MTNPDPDRTPDTAPPKSPHLSESQDQTRHRHRLTSEDHALLAKLRRHAHDDEHKLPPRTIGQKIADSVAETVGSWRFIVIQSCLLVTWIAANALAWAQAWDPYPFILLNLVLSFQAAYTAPIIMMSQNRQGELDRRLAARDARINAKAELEIELLHEKLDHLREQEIARLIGIIERLEARLP